MSGNATVLHGEPCHLGEGPTYDHAEDTAWWFDILGKTLFEHRFASGETRRHPLPFMASQISRIDDRRQLLAGDTGLFVRDRESGRLDLLAPLEADDPTTRSNDGRTHSSGALWIGTMGRKAEQAAGAIYWFRKGEVRCLFSGISIPNAICFSPDGRTGYFCDTRDARLMRVSLDPATGLPTGEPDMLYDARGEDAGLDGAVVDAQGSILVARWGGSRIDILGPDGTKQSEIAVPARQASCPAFVGPRFDKLLVTTAFEGMDGDARALDPQAGITFLLDHRVDGREDPPVLL